MFKTATRAFILAVFGCTALGVALASAQAPPRPPTNVRIVGSSTGGCGLTGKQTGDFHLTTTDGRGTTRDFEVLVPSNYNPSTKWPISFVYHGAGANEAAAKSFGLQDAPGASAAAIFVFPQGVNYGNYGVGWDDSASGYDMVFFDRMLASLEASYCIDAQRVFVAGFSWGCDQATALLCSRGNQIRAAGVASCTDEFTNAADYRTYQACPVRNAAAIRFTHDASGGDSGYPSPSFTTTSALYRSMNACSSTSTPVTPSACSSYASCAAPFVECNYAGLGHALPPNWAAETWAFFSSFR